MDYNNIGEDMSSHPDLPPLRGCISRYIKEVEVYDWVAMASTDLDDHIISADADIAIGRRVDRARAFIWAVHCEYSRRGIAPRYRPMVSEIEFRPERLMGRVRKYDAPYIDLEWLRRHYPEHKTGAKKWNSLFISQTASDLSARANISDDAYLDELFEPPDFFDVAEAIHTRQISIEAKVQLLRLSPEMQAGLRFYCSAAIRETISKARHSRADARVKLNALRKSIPQLSEKEIARRIVYAEAYSLAAKSKNRANATAHIFNFMTGECITDKAAWRQINLMIGQRIIRKHRVRGKVG